MKLNRFSIVMAMLSASMALAQGPGPGGPPRGPGGPGGPHAGGFGMPHQRKLVTGAPYSADVTTTMTRTLADSNTIQHTTTGQVARDSQGRTYSMETVTGGMLGQNGPKTFIFISDPVAGYTYTLNPTTKTAMRRAIHTPNTAMGSGSASPEFSGKTRPANPNAVQADLGTQLLNGVNATGKKTTRTIPAGTMGNTLPIISTSETWFSPDLKVVVASTRNDPQQGTESYALTNIQRTEPPATLFQVPSDYTIKDEGRGGHFGSH